MNVKYSKNSEDMVESLMNVKHSKNSCTQKILVKYRYIIHSIVYIYFIAVLNIHLFHRSLFFQYET